MLHLLFKGSFPLFLAIFFLEQQFCLQYFRFTTGAEAQIASRTSQAALGKIFLRITPLFGDSSLHFRLFTPCKRVYSRQATSLFYRPPILKGTNWAGAQQATGRVENWTRSLQADYTSSRLSFCLFRVPRPDLEGHF